MKADFWCSPEICERVPVTFRKRPFRNNVESVPRPLPFSAFLRAAASARAAALCPRSDRLRRCSGTWCYVSRSQVDAGFVYVAAQVVTDRVRCVSKQFRMEFRLSLVKSDNFSIRIM
ncbi:hypothetical protein R5R35_000266 [Gryllus longicercus]|uniref:Uncharacterized protein n=1 Tax=Gryllus longicercus TaxID=2509291 RepID=A0AAN9VYT0_9ORTH